jgi:hypothetical protein
MLDLMATYQRAADQMAPPLLPSFRARHKAPMIGAMLTVLSPC